MSLEDKSLWAGALMWMKASHVSTSSQMVLKMIEFITMPEILLSEQLDGLFALHHLH